MAVSFKKVLGKRAENLACEYLQAKGFRLLKKNFSLKMGEIDLIMQDQSDIVFIEVRSRGDNTYGSAIESVNYGKQQKLIKTGLYYMQKNRLLYKVNCRFDIIGITESPEGNKINWIKNAFAPR